jgi:anterior pharynx defective protein 1
MTMLEFIGCTLIAFSPALVMFTVSVASDAIRIIILISS